MNNLKSSLFKIFTDCFPYIPMAGNIFSKRIFEGTNKIFVEYASSVPVGFSVLHGNTVVLICVDPDFQNKGIGKKLLKKSEEYISSHGFSNVNLGRCSNGLFFGAVIDSFSHRFFEKQGYVAFNGCLDMVMDLESYSYKNIINKYKCTTDISFEFYRQNDCKELIDAVSAVEPRWVDKFTNTENDSIIVASYNNSIAGFLKLDFDADTIITGDDSKVGMIEYVGVVPEYRNIGIGTNMVAYGAQQLKNALCTDAFIEYTSLDTWYSRIGFEEFIWFWMGSKEL